MELVWPAPRHLPGYVAALEQGWSPNTIRPEAAGEELAAIARDADAFLASMVDPRAEGEPIRQPDGTTTPRLPSYRRWLWDGEFCGSINYRWQDGTPDLPPHVRGHVGYSVVPWKQGRGYATRALALLLPDIAGTGMPFVDLWTDAGNVGSQRVIERNGGVVLRRVPGAGAHGGADLLQYRIVLAKRG